MTLVNMRDEMMKGAPICVAGCGAITAVGRGVSALRSALPVNASGLRPCPEFDSTRFQSRVAGRAPAEEGWRDDPAFGLAATALREAQDEAAGVLGNVRPERLGLVLATTKANIDAMQRRMEGRSCSDSAGRHMQADLLAADLAAEARAGGPVQTVSIACASGLVAIQQGAKLLQRDAADAVLVVGVDHLSDFVVAGFTSLKALDPEGCRPFDRNRCGLSPGEAGAAVVLVREAEGAGLAVRLAGWGNSNDANHMTGPSRDGSGLVLAIRQALALAGLEPGSIDYVNAHGTGTPYNDAMECLALRSVFGEEGPAVSGSKGMLGHTLGAAGVVESVLCITAMREGIMPGTPRLADPDEGAPARLLREPVRGARMQHVMKLNVGFGGINSALVFSHG